MIGRERAYRPGRRLGADRKCQRYRAAGSCPRRQAHSARFPETPRRALSRRCSRLVRGRARRPASVRHRLAGHETKWCRSHVPSLFPNEAPRQAGLVRDERTLSTGAPTSEFHPMGPGSDRGTCLPVYCDTTSDFAGGENGGRFPFPPRRPQSSCSAEDANGKFVNVVQRAYRNVVHPAQEEGVLLDTAALQSPLKSPTCEDFSYVASLKAPPDPCPAAMRYPAPGSRQAPPRR